MPSSSSTSAESFVLGDYVATERLYQGRSGEVYKGRRRQSSAAVALKLPAGGLFEEASHTEQALSQAREIMALQHPNIARMLDCGQTDAGQLWFAMEYVEGPTLKEVIQHRFRLKEGAVALKRSALVDICLQVARGLQAAFRRHVIHRDIKPDNIMIEAKSGVAKIVDFGLAKNLWLGGSTEKEHLSPVGSVRYMSPEHCRGVALDHRSDIYSLGCTFFYLFTAQPPFEAPTDPEIQKRKLTERPPPVRELNPDLPAELSLIIDRMIEPDPTDRYQKYETLIGDLEKAKLAELSREGTTATVATEPARFMRSASHISSMRIASPYLRLFYTSAIILLLGVLSFSVIPGPMMLQEKEGQARRLSLLSCLMYQWLYPESEAEKGSALARGQTRFRLRRVRDALLEYKGREGAFPDQLSALNTLPGMQANYVFDGWGNSLVFNLENRILSSPGMDGAMGTEDDWQYHLERGFIRVPEASSLYPEGNLP